MPSFTPNYFLLKPALTDHIDQTITGMANNFGIIDTTMKAISDNASLTQETVDEIQSDITSINEQLANNARKIAFIDLRAFGAKGGGVTDDTANLQKVIDYARANKIPAINYDKSLIFNISSPLYVDRDTDIDFGYATLNKTTNMVGTGSETFFAVTDTYAVDAFIIIRHPKDYGTSDSSIRNLNLTKSAPSRIKYGIYAPRLARCKFSNIWSRSNATDYCMFGYQWYLVPEFNNIRQDAGLTTWVLKDDGSQLGGSTSIKATQIVGYDQDGCYEIYGCSYTVIDMPLIDRCNKVAFNHNMCPGLTINSPSVEQSNQAMFLRFVGTKATVNSPRILYNRGSVDVDLFLNLISFGSNVTINSGDIGNYDSGTDARNFPIFVTENSHAVLNNVKLPTNGNTWRGLTNGSTLIINDSNGSTFRDATGVGQKVNGLRKFLGSAVPTTGTWYKGEEIINTDTTSQILKWLCVSGGTPGTWEAIYKSNRESKNGVASLVGDGVKQTFTIDHNLGKTPVLLNVSPENTNAGVAGIEYFTSTNTTITLRFKSAVASGVTANVRWYVEG